MTRSVSKPSSSWLKRPPASIRPSAKVEGAGAQSGRAGRSLRFNRFICDGISEGGTLESWEAMRVVAVSEEGPHRLNQLESVHAVVAVRQNMHSLHLRITLLLSSNLARRRMQSKVATPVSQAS